MDNNKRLYFNEIEMAVFHNKLIDELIFNIIDIDKINKIDTKMQVNINRSIRWNIQQSVNKTYL